MFSVFLFFKPLLIEIVIHEIILAALLANASPSKSFSFQLLKQISLFWSQTMPQINRKNIFALIGRH